MRVIVLILCLVLLGTGDAHAASVKVGDMVTISGTLCLKKEDTAALGKEWETNGPAKADVLAMQYVKSKKCVHAPPGYAGFIAQVEEIGQQWTRGKQTSELVSYAVLSKNGATVFVTTMFGISQLSSDEDIAGKSI